MLEEYTSTQLIEELSNRFDAIIIGGIRKGERDKYFLEHIGMPIDCLALVCRLQHKINNYSDEYERLIDSDDV